MSVFLAFGCGVFFGVVLMSLMAMASIDTLPPE